MNNKNRLTAREMIINKKINEARESIITHQIELEFLKKFKQKIDNNEIVLNGQTYSDKNLSVLIDNLSDCCVYDLERLNFYKNIRNEIKRKKVEKTAVKAVEELKKYPEQISINEK